MTNAPWWGVPLVSGVIAFVGVLLAQSVALYNERRKTKREDARRWHTERRAVYVAFIRGLRTCMEGLAEQFYGTQDSSASVIQGAVDLERQMEEVDLLATTQVADAASYALRAIAAIRPLLSSLQEEHFEGMLGEAERRRTAFIAMARIELGIAKPGKRFQISSDSVFGVLGASLKLFGAVVRELLGLSRVSRDDRERRIRP